jgi:cbb3-type cytochrome oxidase maturation protein
MNVIFLLIPLSILLAGCFLGAFIWAVRSGQYEDTYTPSMRVLTDEPKHPKKFRSHAPLKD